MIFTSLVIDNTYFNLSKTVLENTNIFINIKRIEKNLIQLP